MPYITQQQIDLMRTNFRTEMKKIKEITGAVSEAVFCSMFIINSILGDTWFKENIIDNLNTSEEGVDYLQTSFVTERKGYELQSRLTYLAHSLFLLQKCEGFELKINDLHEVNPTNPEVKLEDKATELQILGMLADSGHEVKFKPRTGVKRQDFDTEVIFKNINLSVEIKCKREETPVNVNSLRRTLYHAAKQLPIKKPCVVFVRIPEHWTKHEDITPKLNKMLRIFFRNKDNTHIKAIVFVWEEYIELRDKRMVYILKNKPNLHPTSGNLYLLNELITTQNLTVPFTTTGSAMKLSFGIFRD